MKLAYKFNNLEEKTALVTNYGEEYFEYVPTDKELEPYTHKHGHLLRGSGCKCWTSGEPDECFTIVEFEDNNIMTLEKQIELAKSYIGKTVKNPLYITYKVEKVNVVISKEEAKRLKICSGYVEDEIRNKGYAVVASDEFFAHPVGLLTLEPQMKEVVLNDTYLAKVYKDKIEVGCQTFPVTILKELVEAHESL